MTVPRARKPKPTATDEVARVLHIFDMLGDEMAAKADPRANLSRGEAAQMLSAILATAERIAARTEG